MNDFVASNGIPVYIHDDEGGAVRLFTTMPDGTYPMQAAAGDDVQALREFFRAEEDERRGRWRWPENRDYVVYAARDGDGVHWSVNEATGESHMNTRAGVSSDEHARVARAYFDAHPEPKPWADAKPGDVWVFEIEGEEMLVGLAVQRVLAVGFNTVTGTSIDVDRLSTITGARRVWPADAS